MGGERSAPPLGRLIGNALQHWADHQRLFWLVAGFCGLVFGALRLAEMRGWVGTSSSQSTFVFFVYVFFLYFALHLALFDDPGQWSNLRRKPVPGHKTYPGFVFWGHYVVGTTDPYVGDPLRDRPDVQLGSGGSSGVRFPMMISRWNFVISRLG
jgi:hypothetical protein